MLSQLPPPPCLPPVITTNPNSFSACAGMNALFSVIANGSGLTYQWQVDQGSGFTDLTNVPPYGIVTSNMLIISFVPPGFTGYQYRCSVTDSCSNTISSDAATLTVSPAINLSVNSPTINSGQTAVLTASGATSYFWPGGVPSIPPAGLTTNPISVSPTTTTTYTVTGTTNGCSRTAFAMVTVISNGTGGATGATGSTGATGAIGATGIDGIQGATGIQGETGAIGATGATGADGALSAWGKGGTSGTNPSTDFLGTTDATALAFRTNNIERIRILPSGSIGMGTATPITIGKVVQVSANDANGTSLLLENTVTGGKNWRMLSAATNNTGGAGSFMIVNHTDDPVNPKLLITPSGNIGMGTATPNAIGKTLAIASTVSGGTSLFLENTKSWRVLSTGSANTGGGGNFMIVNHSDDAANPKFTINAAGNVGISTAAPSAKLDIAGNLRVQTVAQNNTATKVLVADATGIVGYKDASSLIGATGPAGAPGADGAANAWSFTGTANTNPAINFIGTTDNVDVVLKTNNAEVLRLAANGNVGVDTNTPQAKLDVNGDAKIANDLTVGGNITFAGNKPISYLPASGGFPEAFGFGIAPRQLPAPQPGLGCGGSLPPFVGTNQFNNLIQSWGDLMSMSMGINIDNTAVIESTVPLSINTVCGKDIYMGGNVGVGTSNPLTKLQVNGSISIYDGDGNTSLFFGAENTSDHAFGKWGIQYVTPNTFSPDFNNKGGLNFWVPYLTGNNGGNNYLFLSDDGNVGIGTTDTKGYKLGVNGKIICEEINVKLYGTWFDHVFDKKYKLMSIEELQEFTKREKHLPDMPTSTDVEKNGINTSEMIGKLLKTQEEQAQYIFQLNEQNKELKKEIEKLQKH